MLTCVLAQLEKRLRTTDTEAKSAYSMLAMRTAFVRNKIRLDSGMKASNQPAGPNS